MKCVALLAPIALIAGCGPANDVTTTNTGNVLLNEAQENYAIRGDNEVAADDMNMVNARNDAGNANMAADNMAGPENGATPNAM